MSSLWSNMAVLVLIGSLSPGPSAYSQVVDLPLADDASSRDVIAENVDLAWDYALGGDVPKALAVLADWERARPTIPDYPFTRGVLLYEDDAQQLALNAFARAIELGAKQEMGLWARLYSADILLIQHVTPRAHAYLDEALKFEGSPRSLLFATNVRQRIRIREEELTEVNEVGGITYYLPPYLIPAKERPALFAKVEAQWRQSLEFLQLDPQTPPPTIYFYPSQRLYEKYIPPETDLTKEAYAHREIHVVFPADEDVLPALAPYALHTLQQAINRSGEPFYLVPRSLDEAIRGQTQSALGLGAFCRAARESGLLPPVESLLDPRNAERIPPEVAEPMLGLLLELIREKFKKEDFQQALVKAQFLGSLPRPVSSYQADFNAFLTDSADLLEDPASLTVAIETIPPFAPIPIVDPALQGDLLAATRLYEEGQPDAGREIVQRILEKEPRYGEARYLLAKELYDDDKFAAARAEFERVLVDTAPHSAAVAFSHFYLGRLAKLRADYPLAMRYYQASMAAGLPQPRRGEAEQYLIALDAYLALTPEEGFSGPDPTAFFAALDHALNTGDGLRTPGVISPQADALRLSELSQWYLAPSQTRLAGNWQHRVKRYSQIRMSQIAAEVEVLRVDEAGVVVRGWKPERRRFLLLQTPVGAQVLDFADESAIFRLRGRLLGLEG